MFLVRLLRICFFALLALVLVVALVFLVIVARALPWKESIPASDHVWTTDIYKQHFDTPEKWPYIETFMCQLLIPYDEIRAELVGEGERDKSRFAAEVFRLLWDARNSQAQLYPPSAPSGPVVGSIGGTAAIRAEVVARTEAVLALAITTAFNGYKGGLEMVEVLMSDERRLAGVQIKCLWHNAYRPRPWKMQWLGVYLQLLARTMWLQRVNVGVRNVAVMGEGEDVRREL